MSLAVDEPARVHPQAAPRELPPLPVPTRTRFQPLRAGLVELFHYDCEEFWFRDGHLLLRGNNGTGKSKVLSLTLPFLLDASLKPSRVEPDGDRSKRMEWNLLMNRYERRIGYTWIEFGRLSEDGSATYVTLGCGLRAIAGRPRVEAWYFLTDQRVGQDLFLISEEQTALSRDRLEQALAGRGRTFEDATRYKRAVDEQLFRLGDRYEALIDTLIQLRQPQLSKKPDEGSLSEALSNALPALAYSVLEDVAEAMNQLDEYRDELDHMQRVRDAVDDFDKRYRGYAQIQARRQARVLRKAQTEFDNQSRAVHEAHTQLEALSTEVARHGVRCGELETKLLQCSAALDELKSDPTMLDARRLSELETAYRDCKKQHERAQQVFSATQNKLEQEASESERRQRELEAAESQLRDSAANAQHAAEACGVSGDHERLTSSFVADEGMQIKRETLEREIKIVSDRRQRQCTALRQRFAALAQRERARDEAETRCANQREQLEVRTTAAREAREHLDDEATTLVGAYRAYVSNLRVLRVDDAEAGLAELEQWVESMSSEQPMRGILERARTEIEEDLARLKSTIEERASLLMQQEAELQSERDTLLAGRQLAPQPAHTRDVPGREQREGAPLWQLLEFREHVSEMQCAGLEAALEGAGLLDAWVTPEGTLLHPDTQDAWLEIGAPREESLRAWLETTPTSAVSAGRVEALLASIGCSLQEQPDADSWLSPLGHFRVGRLRGAYRKHEAHYLGAIARERAKQRRLGKIAERLAEIAQAGDALTKERDQLAMRRKVLQAELAAVPREEELITAHVRFSELEKQRREALEALSRVEALLAAANEEVRTARLVLERDAQDLSLPVNREGLELVEQALAAYRTATGTLVHALEVRTRAKAERSRQNDRELEAREQLGYADGEKAERARKLADTEARLLLLRETAQAAVTELNRRLSAATQELVEISAELDESRKSRDGSRTNHARAEQRAQDEQQRLTERTTARGEAISQLRGFARTGLLTISSPEIPQPDDTSWTIDPALQLARRMEHFLGDVAANDDDWTRAQNDISHHYSTLSRALSSLGQTAQMEPSDFGMVVQIVYQNRAERPDQLGRMLAAEIDERRAVLSAREREVLEKHLQAEVAATLQRLLRESEAQVDRINRELERHPTSTGVYFRLEWETLPEGTDGAPAGLAAARSRLLRRVADAWSEEDRRVIGEFLQLRIQSERSADQTGTLVEHLARALDYRRWHRFRVKRWHDGAFRALSGPASSGERALGLTVPLFAAASSHYASGSSPHAPRLVLLDEAFAGIDDEARSHCMALVREFDLDFVMTSEREWGCYATLPGVSICQVVRREGIDAVYVSRWSWDGKARRQEPDPSRRFQDGRSE